MTSKLKLIIYGAGYAGLIAFVVHSLLYALWNGQLFYGGRGSREWHSYAENPAAFVLAFGIELLCLIGLLSPIVLYVRRRK